MTQDQRSSEQAKSAREHDDSDIVDTEIHAPSTGGSYGGNLQVDVASQAEAERVADPEARDGVDKQDDINHAQRYPAGKRADNRE